RVIGTPGSRKTSIKLIASQNVMAVFGFQANGVFDLSQLPGAPIREFVLPIVPVPPAGWIPKTIRWTKGPATPAPRPSGSRSRFQPSPPGAPPPAGRRFEREAAQPPGGRPTIACLPAARAVLDVFRYVPASGFVTIDPSTSARRKSPPWNR